MFIRLEAYEDDGRSGGFELLYLATEARTGRYGLIKLLPEGWIANLVEKHCNDEDYSKLCETQSLYKKEGTYIGWHLDIKVIDQKHYDDGIKKKKHDEDKAREEQLQRQKEYNERWDARTTLVDSALAKLTDDEVILIAGSISRRGKDD